jgi:dipeptidase E
VRLYLSSLGMGDRFDELVAALPAGAPVALVSNAVDYIPQSDREAYARDVFDPVAFFRSRGFAAEDLDLRAWFARPDALRASLRGVRLVWAVGGNAFLLLRAMRQSGLDELLRERVAARSLIYGGWSAGAVVAGPTLRGIELMDDPGILADGYDPAPVWEGLGLIDYSIVPHFQSDHPEAEAAAKTVAWLRDANLPFKALRDGECIVL